MSATHSAADRSAYEHREVIAFHNDLTVPGLTRAERAESAAEWLQACRETPGIVSARVLWLLQGCYGHGSYLAAREVIANRKMNRAAWLGQAIAALEWKTTPAAARRAWHKLTPAEQTRLTDAINNEITYQVRIDAEEQKENA